VKPGSAAYIARSELHRLQRHIFSLTAHRERWAAADARLAALIADLPLHAELQEIVQEIRLLLTIGRQFVRPDTSVDAADLVIGQLLDDVGLQRPKARACWHGFAAGMQGDHERAAWWFLHACGLAGSYTPMFSYSRTVLPTAAFDAAPAQVALPPGIIFGPPPPAADLQFVVSCDAAYCARYAEQYVTSLRRQFAERAAIHIHLVGMADAAAIAQLGVSWSLEPGELHDLRSRSAIGRYVVAPFVMAQSAARCCVVTDIDEVFEGTTDLPLPAAPALRMKSHGLLQGLPWKRVLAGFALFPNTAAQRTALHRLSWALRAYFRSDQSNWGIDQTVLFAWQRREQQHGMTFLESEDSPLWATRRNAKIRPPAAAAPNDGRGGSA
jgi:hypothetical protein